ncbi:hypothetical protein L211DRAFT_408897 [Terfezia boudieri ATCC MYA-4762]|uniref:Zn(2)-C6 fungal-type domain-containing protein n=1 Tax=Terfezia boudieri ATCC MYA-4762 TaxID=1051890 RepID=A0A3N4LG59_9PEZI|nr:hypothetical protein L211DRAFT_408897 [Terfezia boudieri ATCC MYA-4762]
MYSEVSPGGGGGVLGAGIAINHPSTPRPVGTYFPSVVPNPPPLGHALPLPGSFSHHHHHHHQLQQHQHPPAYTPHEIHPPLAYQSQAYAYDVHPTPTTMNTPALRGPHFKRSYQACMPCRSRKVKCDLGNPDAPNAPPCARCRREGKECVFSGPRASTKRRQDIGGDGTRGIEGTGIGQSQSSSDIEDGEAYDESGSGGGSAGAGGRATKRKKGNNSYPLRRWDEQTATYRRVELVGTGVSPEVQNTRISTWSGDEPLFVRRGKAREDDPDGSRDHVYRSPPAGQGGGSPGYHWWRSGSLHDEYDHDNHTRDEPEEEEGEDDILVTTKMHSTHDALNLLFQAAERASRISQADPSEDGDGNLGSDSEGEGPDQEGGIEQTEKRERGTDDPEPGGTQFGGVCGGDTRSLEESIEQASDCELRRKFKSPLTHQKRKTSDSHNHSTHRWVSHQTKFGNTDSQSYRSTDSFGPSPPTNLSGPIPALLNFPPGSETPWLFEVQPSLSPNPAEESLSRALKVWQTFKFCQLKWVTPLEAFTYVNYFHTHLLPLSPILSGHFALPSAQHDLLTNEPLLAITILTIAARYCPLGGAASRGVYLHDKLWQFTQGLVGRVIWGQDRGTGKIRGKETKGLRGLGTVEALVLWTEWHPRGIHFPPMEVWGEEELMGGMGIGMGLTGYGEGPKEGRGWDVSLVIPMAERGSDEDGNNEMGDGEEKEVKSDRWLEEVVEPTRRSDRLSWMLLGTALNLAHELGIFDTSSADDLAPTPADPSVDIETPRRIFRLRKLCYIYLHSLSTRLNWSSPLDNNRKLLTIITNHTETAYTPGQVVLTKYEQKWHKIMALYLDLTVLVRNATEMLFPSKQLTKEIVRTGRYVGLVEHFGQVLSAWERGSEGLTSQKGVQGGDVKELEEEGVLIPRPFWKVLRIEYCYARIFVYCISLEAVGERRKWQQMEKGKEKGKEKHVGEAVKGKDTLPDAAPGLLRDSFLSGAFGEEEVDWDFIQMAFSSGLEILSIVTTNGECGAGQTNSTAPPAVPWLRFAPVRVFVRIIFAAIFLLKATALLLSLGPGTAPRSTRTAIQTQSKKCLHLLSRTIEVLKICAVDDVHLANTFAELLGMHVEVLKWRVYPRGGGRGAHGAHARGGRGGGVGRGGGTVGIIARGVTSVVDHTTPAPSGANTTATLKLEVEKEIEVDSPAIPPGMHDDDHHENPHPSDASNIPHEPANLENGSIHNYNPVNTPTTYPTNFSMIPGSTCTPSTSPNLLSQLPASNSPLTIPSTATVAGQTPAHISPFPTTPANSMWAFTTRNPLLDFTGAPSTSSLPADSIHATSLADIGQQQPSEAEWEFPEMCLDGVFGMGGGDSATAMGEEGEIQNVAGGMVDGVADLGVYGIPGGMGEEDGVMDFLWDYSMGGGGLS